jgi:hypothetical protein
LRTENRNRRAGDQPVTGSDYQHHHGIDNHDDDFFADTLNNSRSHPSNVCMKKYICLFVGAALLAACEQKETTVTNPPAEKTEKKESNTTIINPSPATKTETKTDINVNTSPSP